MLQQKKHPKLCWLYTEKFMSIYCTVVVFLPKDFSNTKTKKRQWKYCMNASNWRIPYLHGALQESNAYIEHLVTTESVK